MKIKCLIYCTKSSKKLIKGKDNFEIFKFTNDMVMKDHNTGEELNIDCFSGNGKVVARFYCDNVEKYYNAGYFVGIKDNPMINICNKACISRDELDDYCQGKHFYAIHISKLEVFDRPKELYEFKKPFPIKKCKNCLHDFDCAFSKIENQMHHCRDLIKAPQNMMWVEYEGERYCLISIRPEWVAKILNGEKTIEVRKKVLKGML